MSAVATLFVGWFTCWEKDRHHRKSKASRSPDDPIMRKKSKSVSWLGKALKNDVYVNNCVFELGEGDLFVDVNIQAGEEELREVLHETLHHRVIPTVLRNNLIEADVA